jgi:superfamily I DNA and/or RNA helicase
MLAAQRLAERRPEGREFFKDGRIAMHTADNFQNSEAEVVILSCVRTRRLGFLEVVRRLNVAITRARRGLIVLGNMSHFKNVLEQAGSRGEHINALLRDAGQRDLVLPEAELRLAIE